MTILEDDIKLRQSVRNNDTPTGGGRMGATEVVDGVLNNLFDDQSREDRRQGRLSARKLWTQINSQDTDPYLGAHRIITKDAADENVYVVAYAAASSTETREQMMDRLTNGYRELLAPSSAVQLYGDVTAGALAIRVVVDDTNQLQLQHFIDQIGSDIWGLRYNPGGGADPVVRIVRPVAVTYSHLQGATQDIDPPNTTHTYQVYIVELATIINYAFPGSDPSTLGDTSPTPIYSTSQTTAALVDTLFYGGTKAQQDRSPGDTTIRVAEVMLPIAPDEVIDPDLIGIDPSPLPLHHRVPIITEVQGVVVADTDEFTLPDPAVAGATYDVGRTFLSLLKLYDQNGVKVPADRYTPNLVAGTFEMANPLDLTGFAQPLVAEHRVEDFAQVDTVEDVEGQTDLGPTPSVAGSPYDVAPDDADIIVLYRSSNDAAFPYALVDPDIYTIDLANGEVTFVEEPEDLSPNGNYRALWWKWSDVTISLDRQLTHDYVAARTVVSSILSFGTLQASVARLFTQQAWTGEWADEPIGSPAGFGFDELNFPIEVTNAGAVTERWRAEFVSTIAFRVYGESAEIGELTPPGGGNWETDEVVAPINPATGSPYFTIQPDAWSGTPSQGNVLRWDTIGAVASDWELRCTLPAPETEPTDDYRVQTRGDLN